MNDVRRILRLDPVWSAYALCDLEPRVAPWAEWRTSGDALLLLYREFATPILFATPGAEGLIGQLKEERVSLQVPLSLEPALRERFAEVTTNRVIRMWLAGAPPAEEAEALRDAAEIEALYATGEAPDFFHASMLADEAFRGLRNAEGQLVAVAGTHTVSDTESVAAIGNVFVHPAARGRGLGARVVSATASVLARRGIRTIVLNVREANAGAVRLYRRLGFVEHSVFLEGYAMAPKRR